MELSSAGNDVELCGDMIGIALDGNPGTLELYNLYDKNQLSLVASIPGKLEKQGSLFKKLNRNSDFFSQYTYRAYCLNSLMWVSVKEKYKGQEVICVLWV